MYVVVCVVAPFCNDHYYGNVQTHALLDKKEHDPEHRGGVCCRGNLTDHERHRREAIRGYAPGYGRSTPGRPVRLLLRQLLPVVVLVLYPPTRYAGSYTWPERVLLLGSVTTVAPIGNIRSASSRGGVVSVFARSFNVLEAGGGCTDSTVHGKQRAVVC